MTVHIRNLNIIVVPVHHPVGSAAVIHQAVSVPVIQAVPVVIQVVSVPVAVSAADGDNVNMPTIPAAISSASMKTVRDSVPETMMPTSTGHEIAVGTTSAAGKIPASLSAL